MSVLGIFIHLKQYGMDRDHLSDSDWVLTISAHFLSNFDPNLTNCTLQMTMKTLKLACYHSLMSVLRICIHSNQCGNRKGSIEWPKVGIWSFQPIFHQFWGKFVHYHPSNDHETLKTFLLEALMSVLCICIHSTQLSDSMWEFDH